jgi:DNA-binding FadR family transcriptional regulator
MAIDIGAHYKLSDQLTSGHLPWHADLMARAVRKPRLTPIPRRSLSDAVFEQLREQIVSGAMASGSPLPAERLLCEALGVNRSSVREALRRLQQAGLLAVRHGGTSQVLDYRESAGLDLLEALLVTPAGDFDPHVIRSVLQMRSAIAPDAVRLAATRGRAGLADRLDAIVAEMRKADRDLPRLQDLALKFWEAIVSASENVAYRLAYNSLRRTYDKCRALLQAVLADELADVAAYAAIAGAFRRGDVRAAESKARRLMRRGEEAIGTALKDLESSVRRAS